MFKRRKKQPLFRRLLNLIWPKNGWKRASKYILLRLNRLKGTPREIAAGVACGVAISFTPFVGFHFVLAAITAWFVRGNILASALGTAAGNPWTFPLIWLSVFYCGLWLTGGDASIAHHLNFYDVFKESTHALLSFDFSAFAHDIWSVFYPMLIGCVPFCIAVWLLSYYTVKYMLLHLKPAKEKKQ